MKVLMLTKDKKILDENSEVSRRTGEYKQLVEKLDVLLVQKSDILSAIKRGKKIEKPDLVTCQDPFETGFIGWKLAKHFGAKLQLQIHTDFLSPYFKRESLKNRIRVWLAKFLIPRASCIRVVSERIKNSLLKFNFNSSKITVLPIFVDMEKIKSAPVKVDLHQKYPQFDFIILMASRITKEKNIKLALQAFRDTNMRMRANDTNNTNIGLIIVGNGPEREALKLQITNYKLQKNVILENWSNDLASYYKSADLFLLTSNYEGYSMAVVEAMAAGCPVVMTDVGIAGDILKDGYSGLVVPVGNKEKLTEAILKMVKDFSLRSNLANSAEYAINEIKLDKEGYLKRYKQGFDCCRLSA